MAKFAHIEDFDEFSSARTLIHFWDRQELTPREKLMQHYRKTNCDPQDLDIMKGSEKILAPLSELQAAWKELQADPPEW